MLFYNLWTSLYVESKWYKQNSHIEFHKLEKSSEYLKTSGEDVII